MTAAPDEEIETFENPPAEGAPLENGAGESAAKTSEKLEAELQDLRDKNLRLYAEFDNFRKRAAKESFDLIATANARLIGKLTEVLDNFQRAFDPKLKAAPEDFEKGVKLIYSRLKELLEDEGLEAIEATGSEFDPNLHDAMLQQASDTVPENHVIQTVQKGYKLKAKILSHAKVIVSKGKDA